MRQAAWLLTASGVSLPAGLLPHLAPDPAASTFDYVMIDEAGQALLPEALVPLVLAKPGMAASWQLPSSTCQTAGWCRLAKHRRSQLRWCWEGVGSRMSGWAPSLRAPHALHA